MFIIINVSKKNIKKTRVSDKSISNYPLTIRIREGEGGKEGGKTCFVTPPLAFPQCQ